MIRPAEATASARMTGQAPRNPHQKDSGVPASKEYRMRTLWELSAERRESTNGQMG